MEAAILEAEPHLGGGATVCKGIPSADFEVSEKTFPYILLISDIDSNIHMQ